MTKWSRAGKERKAFTKAFQNMPMNNISKICRPEKAPPFLQGGGAIKGATNEEQPRAG